MTTKEKIQEWEQQKQDLLTKITTLGSIEVDFDSPTCPFCGAERHRLPLGTGYFVCNCIDAQNQLIKAKNLSDEQQDLNIRIDLLERKIEAEKGKAERLLKESNLGRRFKGRTFDTFEVNADNKNAYEKCRYFAEHFNDEELNGLILAGTVGTGKTHLVGAITHYIIDNYGIPVKFITAIELFGKLRDFESDTMNEFKNTSLLIVDDLGKEKVTDWNREKLFEIINARYEDYLPTIITTNLTPKQMQESFGDAVYSRIMEMCDAVVLNGKDNRRK